METDVKKVKQAKENKKSGILKSFKILWSIMGTKEKISFILILFSELLVPIIKLWQAFLPSLILSRIIGEDVLIWGFINFSAVSDVAYYAIVLMSIPVLWVFGMLVYRAIDIFARRMMCKANEKVQDLLLEERKNLDFKMTNGEVYYIVKNAVDNIYNIIEPALWEFYANILSLIILCVQFFVYDINVGFIVIAYLCLLLVCVFVRTLVQEKVVGKIENINAKIGNHFLMSLTNLPMITMFSSKLKELSVLKNLNDDFYKENKTRANIGFWYWVIIIVVEYGGMLGIVLYLVLTNQPNLATTIISTLTMIESMISMVENWGFSLNNLQHRKNLSRKERFD